MDAVCRRRIGSCSRQQVRWFTDPSGRYLYAADQGRGLVRSEDGGQSWNAVIGNLPNVDVVVADIASDPADPTVAYVALGENGVYKTTNGGERGNRALG